jgi:hypothetical protein
MFDRETTKKVDHFSTKKLLIKNNNLKFQKVLKEA